MITLAGRFLAWLAGAWLGTQITRTRVYYVPPTSWLDRWFFKPTKVIAFTWGETVLMQEAFASDESVLAHELVHVEQARRYGWRWVPAYLWASVQAWRRGEHWYYDNKFEREAYERS